MNSFRCLNLEHENVEPGQLSAAHTAVFIAGERKSHWWLPDGKELSNPAESHERFSEEMSSRSVVSQRDTLDLGLEVWKPAGEYQWTSLSYSGSQHGVPVQRVNQVKWLLPNRGKVGQRKWKGWSPVQTLICPWSDFDEDVNYRTMSLKPYPIPARNYWRDMDRKKKKKRQFYDQCFPFWNTLNQAERGHIFFLLC